MTIRRISTGRLRRASAAPLLGNVQYNNMRILPDILVGAARFVVVLILSFLLFVASMLPHIECQINSYAAVSMVGSWLALLFQCMHGVDHWMLSSTIGDWFSETTNTDALLLKNLGGPLILASYLFFLPTLVHRINLKREFWSLYSIHIAGGILAGIVSAIAQGSDVSVSDHVEQGMLMLVLLLPVLGLDWGFWRLNKHFADKRRLSNNTSESIVANRAKLSR